MGASKDFEEQLAGIDAMVDFILERVEEPEDKEEARELLIGPEGLSLEELRNVGNQVVGVDESPLT
jgi:hypothetical protein